MFLVRNFNLRFNKDNIDQIFIFLILLCICLLEPTNNISAKGLIFCVICLLWRESTLRNQWFKVVWPWFLSVFFYFLSVSFYALSPPASLHDGGVVLKGILMSFLGLYLCAQSEANVKYALKWVSGFLVVFTVFIIVFNLYNIGFNSIFRSPGWVGVTDRGFEWITNRNRLAVGFSIAFIYIASVVLDEVNIFKIWFGELCLFVIGWASLLNGSRGALAAMLIATIVILFFKIREHGSKRILNMKFLILPLLVCLSVLMGGFLSLDDLLHGGSFDNGRVEIWRVVIDQITLSPWIGYGPHAMPFDAAITNQKLLSYVFPHSIYLGLFYASGIVGLIFWVVWFASLHYKIRSHFFIMNKTIFFVAVGLVANILVHGLVDLDFYSMSVISYLVVGLVVLSSKVSKANV